MPRRATSLFGLPSQKGRSDARRMHHAHGHPGHQSGRCRAAHSENPVLTLPASAMPKAHIPIVPSLGVVTDEFRGEVDVYAIDTRGALDVIRKIPDHVLKPPIASAGLHQPARNSHSLRAARVFSVWTSPTIRMVSNDKAATPLSRPNYNPI